MTAIKHMYKTGDGKLSTRNCTRLYPISLRYAFTLSPHIINLVDNGSNIYTNR